MSFKETAIDNQRRHEAFRKYYWYNQTNYMFKMCIAALIMGIVCLAAFLPTVFKGREIIGIIKYGYIVVANVIALPPLAWLLRKNDEKDSKKPAISELVGWLIGEGYLLWGVLCMGISIYEKQPLDILSYVITLAIVTAFYLFPGHHYFAMIFFSYIVATVIFLFNLGNNSVSLLLGIEAVLIMVLLFRLGQNRYITTRNNFEADCRNKSLLEEAEASNEELIAINTELTDTTAKLEDALAKVQASSDYQKAFSASMNHDMRAPLNGIIGTVQVMLLNKNLTEEQKEDLNVCMSSSKTLLSLVNDVLDYSKIEAGQLEILPAEFDLHNVVNDVVGMFKPQIEKKGLNFKLEVDPDTHCSLYGDDFRIQQVLTNILSNAIKYTEKGSVTLNVSVKEDTRLVFVVSDTGQGMSKESLKDLYIPFKRINEKNNQRIQGTGLGMAIVHNIIEKMDGDMRVVSEFGKGSTFTITIPVKVTDTQNTWKNSISKVSEEENITADFEGRHLLYIDDTAVNLKIVSKMLADTKAAVAITTKPEEGLKMLSENEYDVILVDHLMPEIDGEEVFRRLRTGGGVNAEKPVIILTGNSGAGIEEHYRKLGFAGYITKPIMRPQLIELIKEAIN